MGKGYVDFDTLIKDAGGFWCESDVEKIDPNSFFISQEKSIDEKNTEGQGELFD